MNFLPEEYLDRLLAPKAFDPRWVAHILHTYIPGYTLQELEALAKEWAARDGYDCVCQMSPALRADGNR